MNITIRLFLSISLAFALVACGKQDEAQQKTVKAPLAAPTTDDGNAWREYVKDVVGRNMDGVTNPPYVYLLPAESTADFQGSYDRLRDKARQDMSRGIMGGNMLAFCSASTSSTKVADLLLDAFEDVKPDSLKGVKLLFIGKADDNERVRSAVILSGVNYVFVETK